jgi:hypothetical protein
VPLAAYKLLDRAIEQKLACRPKSEKLLRRGASLPSETYPQIAVTQ